MMFQEIGNPTYIALETFRKSGEGVVTPVWVVAEDGKLYVWTIDGSGKVKRIRNNGRVRLAVSDARGAPKSAWADAQARVLDAPEDETRQRQRMAAKYGIQFRFFAVMNMVRRDKSKHIVLEISAVE